MSEEKKEEIILQKHTGGLTTWSKGEMMVYAYCEHCMQNRNFIIASGVPYCEGCDDIAEALTVRCPLCGLVMLDIPNKTGFDYVCPECGIRD